MGNVDNFWQGAAYFGVGAAAGALTAGVASGFAVGGAVAANGGTFAAGFSSGFGGAFSGGAVFGASAGGFLGGAGAGFTSGFVSGFGNSLVAGNSFGSSLGTGFRNGAIGGAVGGALGGYGAARDGRNFWNGGKTYSPFKSYAIEGPKTELPGLPEPRLSEVELVDPIYNHDSYYNRAMAYKDVPYLKGGQSLEGIDCSGLLCESVGTDNGWWTGADFNPPGNWSRNTFNSVKDFRAFAREGDYFLWKDAGHGAFFAGGNRLFHAHGVAGTPTGFTGDLAWYLRTYALPIVFRQR